MSFVGRYVYTYVELVFRDRSYRSATEWQWQNKNTDNKNKNKKNKQIRNNNIHIDNCMYRYITMDNFVSTTILCAIRADPPYTQNTHAV